MNDAMQLPLGLAMPDYATWDQVYTRSEDMIVAQLKAFAADQGEGFILLQGAQGSGKTVLLQTVCQDQESGQLIWRLHVC